MVHVQRIYFCYHYDLTEHLFAALVDFLIILEGRGRHLSQRMLIGTQGKLLAEQRQILKRALQMASDEVKSLSGNPQTIFSSGFIGVATLVVKQVTEVEPLHDPLEIARDFIAYSQLEAAMDLLETAIVADPYRQALHDDLLELYKVTQSTERFVKMYEIIAQKRTPTPVGWNELKGFFNEG
jgi:hypothetical protein